MKPSRSRRHLQPVRPSSGGRVSPQRDASEEPLEWVGGSPASRELSRQFQMAAASPAPVLLEGETGVGKDLAARLIHRHGDRRDQPFVAVNATSLGETLFEAELFGHVERSFSDVREHHDGLVRTADGGTLFVDEIGELSPSSQSKLLRFLDHREVRPLGSCDTYTVDVRIICASNRDLTREVENHRFRRDLYYRLKVLSIRIPPLRERPEDVAPLARSFCERFCERFEKRHEGLDAEALDLLMAYDWPGNVRELANEIKRAVVLMPEPRPLGVDLLSPGIARGRTARHSGDRRSLKQRSRDLERSMVLQCLERHGWNVSSAARELEMSRVGLAKKIRLLGLRRSNGRTSMR